MRRGRRRMGRIVAIVFVFVASFGLTQGNGYDNEACTDDSGCRGGSCQNFVCQGLLQIPFQSISGESTTITGSYITDFNSDTGGIVVKQPSQIITLYGEVRTIYELSSPITFDKFTYLRFDMSEVVQGTGTGFCFYNQPSSQTDFFDAPNKRCFFLGSSSIGQSESDNVIVTVKGTSVDFSGQLKNYALGKPATQSSTYTSGAASNAVDGNTDGHFNFQNATLNSVTSTSSQLNPWWQVDLEGSFLIREIKIYKRLDGYSGRLLNFNLQVLSDTGQVRFEKEFEDLGNDDEVIIVNVRELSGVNTIIGSKVKITLFGDVPRILSLAEFQVFGEEKEFDLPIGDLLNVPTLDFNRVAFIQDGGLFTEAVFSGMLFTQMPVKPISTVSWLEQAPSNSIDGNIQGTNTVNRSNNGVYISLRKGSSKLSIYHENLVFEYNDPFTIETVALANNGIMICSAFRENVGAAVRMLRIADFGVAQIETKIGPPGMGRGIAITPEADKVVMGNPLKEEVYIYDLSSSFKFMDNSKVTLKTPAFLEGSKFGEKVGLSKSGKTLAVAAPEYKRDDGTTVGAILLFTYDSEKMEWKQLGLAIYGNELRLGIGQGGVAVSDELAIVDANDSSGNRVSYQFQNVCSDRYAVPLVEDATPFSSSCECGIGRKSSHIEGGKLLQSQEDVCIPCNSPEGSGDCSREPLGPTFAPTTDSPTSRPSILSDAPSHTPTFITSAPSEFPTSSADSLYDGAYCRVNMECISNLCENNVCKSEVFEFDLKKTADSPVEGINALVIPSSDSGGGVLVSPNGKITLHGSVNKMFRIESIVLISQNTRLRVQIENIDEAEGLYVCFFQKRESFDPEDPRCYQPDLKSSFSDIIGFGEIAFGSRAGSVKFLLFVQSSGTSALSNLFVSTDTGGVLCGTVCCDANAEVQGADCVCNDGYVSSVGGEKILYSFDEICISCQETSSCGFDGDSCNINGYCWNGNCSSGACESDFITIDDAESSGGVTATLIGDFNQNLNYSGGIIASSADDAVSIYGNAHKIFELAAPISFTKVTSFRFNFERIQDPFSNVGDNTDSEVTVCLYEDQDGDSARLLNDHDEHRCTIVSNITTTVPFGAEYLFKRRASIKYIVFKQTVNDFNPTRAITVKISEVEVIRAQPLDQITSSGTCSDANAEQLPQNDKCICKMGYVSSNGGRELLSNFDACVPNKVPIGYDKDVCYVNRTCLSGLCDSNKCIGSSFSISDYDGTPIGGEINVDLSLGGGGVSVNNAGKIELFGNTKVIYELFDHVSFNGFTQLKFNFTKYSAEVTSLGICLYDTPQLISCALNCYTIRALDTSPIIIDGAKLLSYRSSDLKYVGFVQETSGDDSVRSSFDSIEVVAGQTRDAYENGQCTDPNARDVYGPTKFIGEEEIKCACTDGYFSTNGGKLLRNEDKCISCIDQVCDSPLPQTINCAGPLLVQVLLGGLGSPPIPLHGNLLKEPFAPVLETGEGGGPEIQDGSSVSFYGGSSKTYQLSASYTIDAFSSLRFHLYSKDTERFLAMCLHSEVDSNNSASTLCYKLGKNEDTWNTTAYPTLNFNLALGKQAAQKQGNVDYDASNAVDGNIISEMVEDDKTYPVTLTKRQSFPWWEVNLGDNFYIDRVKIHFTKDRRVDILSNYTVEIYNTDGILTYHYLGAEVDNILEAPFEATILLPTEIIPGSRVRIIMTGEDRQISLREVEVFERKYLGSPRRLIDIPIGKHREGMVVNYISFIKSTLDRGDVTNFHEILLVYGNTTSMSS